MSCRAHLDALRGAVPVILPSLLQCDFGNLEREIRALEAAGVRALHLDVMDGSFVPNLTYGMPIVAAIRRLTDLPLDVHLMISHPQRYVEAFRDAGADLLTVHVEAVQDPATVLQQIRSAKMGAGVALNPGTPLSAIESHLELCDLVLVMSVDAGFGGQAFNPVALEKIRRLSAIADPRVMIEVDGGINETTIQQCAAAGAGYMVVGSAIFKQLEYAPAIRRLQDLAGAPST